MGKFNRILILNIELSGINKFLFSVLKKEGWELEVCNIPLPRGAVCWAYISTFHFNLSRWKKRLSTKLGSYGKCPRIFRQRTIYCEKILKEKWRVGDLIFQIGGFFAPATTREKLIGQYVLFLDFTTKLSEKEYPPWANFASEEDRTSWYEWETYLYQNASALLPTNANAKNSLMEDYFIKEELISVVGCGFNLENMCSSVKSQAESKILFIGYDFERKGGSTVIEAFSLVKQALPQAELTIVGPLPPQNVPSDINWLGPVKDRQKISQLLEEAALFAMPSICEPFGIVFLEAMSYGLPCIGSRRDAMPEIIEEGKTGYLIEPGDVKDLAQKIIKILTDNKLRQEMGKEALQKVKYFTWEKVGQRITNAIKNIS